MPVQTPTSLAARYRRATLQKTKEKILREVETYLTKQGDKKAFADLAELCYRTFQRRAEKVRGSDGNDSRKRRSNVRASAVLAVREELIKTRSGPHACSAKRVVAKLETQRARSPRTVLKVSRQSVQRYVCKAIKEGRCSPRPEALPRTNEPIFSQCKSQ